jgi:hypothetical protein
MSDIQFVGGDHPVGTDVTDLRINVLVPQSEREKVLDNFYEYRTNGQDARAMDRLAKVERRQKDGVPKQEYGELQSSDLTDLMERFTSRTATNSLDKVYLDETNKNAQILSKDELEIITKNNAIHELEENTDKTYKSIFSITMFIFTIVILAVLTLAKSLANLSDSIYMTLVYVIVIAYVLYTLYIFNAFYVKDAMDRILGLRKIDVSGLQIHVGKMDKRTYIQEQCRKKKKLGYYDINSGVNEEDVTPTGDLLARIGNNNRYYYNDGNAPKKQLFPTKFDSNQFIVYSDYDTTVRGKEGERVKTSGL